MYSSTTLITWLLICYVKSSGDIEEVLTWEYLRLAWWGVAWPLGCIVSNFLPTVTVASIGAHLAFTLDAGLLIYGLAVFS